MIPSNQTDVAPDALNDLEDLRKGIETVVNHFCSWNVEQLKVVSSKYQDKVQLLTEEHLQTCLAYKEVLQFASNEADLGVVLAHDIVYFLDQLLGEEIPRNEITELLEDLEITTGKLLNSSNKLQERLTTVRRGLLSAQAHLPQLKEDITADRSAALAMRKPANRIAKESAVNSANTGTIWGTVRAFFADSSVPGAHAQVDEYQDETENYENQFQVLKTAATVLRRLNRGLGAVIEVVGKHIEYWKRLHSAIMAAQLDPERLFRENGLPKVAIVKTHRQGWAEIEEKYRSYGETAVSSRQVLDQR